LAAKFRAAGSADTAASVTTVLGNLVESPLPRNFRYALQIGVNREHPALSVSSLEAVGAPT